MRRPSQSYVKKVLSSEKISVFKRGKSLLVRRLRNMFDDCLCPSSKGNIEKFEVSLEEEQRIKSIRR